MQTLEPRPHAPRGQSLLQPRSSAQLRAQVKDTHLEGRRVGFQRLQESRHAERQVPHGCEQQRGREAADGDQHLHLGGQVADGGGPGPAARPPASVTAGAGATGSSRCGSRAPGATRASPAHAVLRPRASGTDERLAPPSLPSHCHSSRLAPQACLLCVCTDRAAPGLAHVPPHAAPPSSSAAWSPVRQQPRHVAVWQGQAWPWRHSVGPWSLGNTASPTRHLLGHSAVT